MRPSFRPEVMLLDIGLPGMDGYEVARRVRELPGGDRIQLIALTGYGQSDDRRRALAAGFDAHLVKPVEPAKLAQVSVDGLEHKETGAAAAAPVDWPSTRARTP